MGASRPLDPSQLAAAPETGRAETLPGGVDGDERIRG